MVSLLQTKLYCPTIPTKRVKRPLLTQRLQSGLEAGRSITLVSAPAGFGKTTCISDWLQTLTLPVAWLSLDAADDEPGRFFSYLLAALQTVFPDHKVVGVPSRGLLGSGTAGGAGMRGVAKCSCVVTDVLPGVPRTVSMNEFLPSRP